MMMTLMVELGQSEDSFGEEENAGTGGEGQKKPQDHSNKHLTVS